MPSGCSRSTRPRGSSSRSWWSRTPAASASGTDDILCLSDGRFGFKVAHPATGSRVSTSSYEAVKEEREQAEEAERLRLYYVAMTRAMDRLIVSGSVDPASDRDDRTPIGWVLDRLGLGEELSRADVGAPVEVERGNAGVVLRVDRFDPEAAAAAAARAPRKPPSPSCSVPRASSSSSRAPARRFRRPRRGCASSP